MDLSPYVEGLRHDLAAAVATGGPDVARAGELLAGALDPATRLALLDALAAAAAEVTAALPQATVEVRLRGRDPELVVALAAPEPEPEPAASGEDEGTARVTLRLPETLKARAEQAAAREGLSVNAWLVRAVARGLEPGSKTTHGPRRITGYARG
jgi:hypothetical protein